MPADRPDPFVMEHEGGFVGWMGLAERLGFAEHGWFEFGAECRLMGGVGRASLSLAERRHVGLL